MNMVISGAFKAPTCATKKQVVKNENSKTKLKEKGSFRAYGTSQLASAIPFPVSLLAINGIQKSSKGLSKEQIETINKAADKMIEASGLRAKGVKIDNVTWAGLNLTGVPDSIFDIVNTYSAVAHGKNAAFLEKEAKNLITGEVLHSANTIIANRDKLPTALFHEVGHAINRNSSKFFCLLQKMRMPSMFLASSLALFSAFSKNAEAKEGEELTGAQKTKNFVRKNSGVLATASMLPVVAEEIMASVRGSKWANANLPKELAKRVNKSNIWGAVSYIAVAVGFGIAATVATKVKDSIMEKQKAKLELE